MKPLDGKTISILGLGASGAAATRLALAKGGRVYVSDKHAEPSIAARGAELGALGAEVELGGHDLERLARSDTVVVSPGIPPDAPVLQALRSRGVRWVSEPEFAFRFLAGPLIAVTGTNGKTTTAALTAHLLRQGGVEVGLGGNIGAAFGPPASELALLEPAPEWVVLEVSSFQLSDIVDFAPDIGVVTNLAPDHLDRYARIEDYYADKARIFDNATSRSRWVLNADDPGVGELAGDAPGRRFWFSTRGPDGLTSGEGADAFLKDQVLTLRGDLPSTEDIPLLPQDRLPLLGRHNAANALAAALTASVAGVPARKLAPGLRSFQPLPHRLEPVARAHGIRWVNDSKATNVAATVGALESLDGPLVLLLGGKDKGEDLAPLRAALHPGVRGVVLFGEARARIAAALAGAGGLRVVDGPFEEAVAAARTLAEPGDLILLSPACSSFDMFENYEARGRRFAALARGEA
ncbi:MAG: UDP-N-acetylmuramoyl-L-alanine--D-glutamate ligase [Longimicrobiales bacterium]